MEYVEQKVAGLTLHLPTTWLQEKERFLDNDDNDIYRNPGRSANKLHQQFSSKMGEDTFKHIQSALHLGAECHVHDGFKQRNTAVAQGSKYIVAFTWNNGKTPKEESGTYDTWKKHRGEKIHVPIGILSGVGGNSVIQNFFPKASDDTSIPEPSSSGCLYCLEEVHCKEHSLQNYVPRFSCFFFTGWRKAFCQWVIIIPWLGMILCVQFPIRWW